MTHVHTEKHTVSDYDWFSTAAITSARDKALKILDYLYAVNNAIICGILKYITVHSAEKYLQRSPKQNKRDHPKTEINLMGMWKNIVISRSLVMYFDFSFI